MKKQQEFICNHHIFRPICMYSYGNPNIKIDELPLTYVDTSNSRCDLCSITKKKAEQ